MGMGVAKGDLPKRQPRRRALYLRKPQRGFYLCADLVFVRPSIARYRLFYLWGCIQKTGYYIGYSTVLLPLLLVPRKKRVLAFWLKNSSSTATASGLKVFIIKLVFHILSKAAAAQGAEASVVIAS